MTRLTSKTKPRRHGSAVTHRAGRIAPAAFDRTAAGDADMGDLSPSLEFDRDSDEDSQLKAIFEASSDIEDPMMDDPDGPRRR